MGTSRSGTEKMKHVLVLSTPKNVPVEDLKSLFGGGEFFCTYVHKMVIAYGSEDLSFPHSPRTKISEVNIVFNRNILPSRGPISLMRTHNPHYARSEYHTRLAKMSFDNILDLTAGLYFYFCYIFYQR